MYLSSKQIHHPVLREPHLWRPDLSPQPRDVVGPKQKERLTKHPDLDLLSP